MLGFLYKDFRVALKSWFMILGLYLLLNVILIPAVFNGMRMKSDEQDTGIFVLMIVLFFYMLYLLVSACGKEIFQGDEKMLWQCFAISTPGAMKAQIQSKYLVILTMNLGITFVCMISDTLYVLIAGDAGISMTIALLFLFCWNIIKESVSLPFVYAFGVSYGNSVKILMLSVGFFLVTVYGLFGDISFFLNKNILESLKELLGSGNVIWVLAIMPYIAMLAYYVSYRISILVYRRGLENNE